MSKSLRTIGLTAIGFCLAGPLALAAQESPQQSGGGTTTVTPAPSVAEAARKTREQKKNAPQPKTVWTEDNIPKSPSTAPVSAVGQPAGTTSEGGGAGETAAGTPVAGTGTETPAGGGPEGTAAAKTTAADDAAKQAALEADWRKRFAEAHKKLEDDEKELDVMQREYNLKRQQYYSDPNTAMREQYSYPSGRGGDLNDLAKKIEDKKAAIEQDKQAIENLEDQLRRAGLPSGWARTP